MPRVFISYRRDDAAGYAGRLYDSLAPRYGPDQVFMDIDTIRPGADFVAVIEGAVGSADVVIALIGPRWATVTDAEGRRRLDNPEDYVRIELAAALRREIVVIPVLVQGADMPRSTDLPGPLAPLARRNAIEMSDARWHYDVARLAGALDGLERTPPPTRSGAEPPLRSPASPVARRTPRHEGKGGRASRGLLIGLAATLAALVAVAVVRPWNGLPSRPSPTGVLPTVTPELASPSGPARPTLATQPPGPTPTAASRVAQTQPLGPTTTPPQLGATVSIASGPGPPVAPPPEFWTVCVWCDFGTHDPRSDAESIAMQLRAAGKPAEILSSTDYASLNRDYWVVYSGVFDTQQAAAAHLDSLARAGFTGFVRLVSKRAAPQPTPTQQPFWTAIVASSAGRAEAEAVAASLRARGFDPILLWSSDYASLNPGYWVTSVGRFGDRASAEDAAQRLRQLGFSGAYGREVRP